MYSFLFRFLDFVRLSLVPSSAVRDSFFPFTKNFVHGKIKEARVEGMEKGGKEERDVFSKKVNKTKKKSRKLYCAMIANLALHGEGFVILNYIVN